MKDNKKKWLRFRHRVVRNLAELVMRPFCLIKYGIWVKRYPQQGKRKYLVLYNHQTAFDQFFVGMAFRGPLYYVASEDLFSKGWLSSMIRYLVAPIPIKKQSTDVRAVIDCMRVAKEGGSIAIAPEGNRTFSGRTGYMNPAIAPLARKLGLPIAFFRIEGGYGVHPRWSDVKRRGKMTGYVSRVLEPEEIASLSDGELHALIKEELFVDEGKSDAIFKSKKSAEYLERAFYVCPYHGLSEFESRADTITCKRCGRAVRYLPTKELSGVGFDFPFKFATEWYDYQCDFIRKLDLSEFCESAMYVERARLSEIIPYKRRTVIEENADVSLFGDRIVISGEAEMIFPFDKISAVAVLGRNKVNIYIDKKIFQIKGDKRMNGLKFVNVFYRYKATERGDENGIFLGI